MIHMSLPKCRDQKWWCKIFEGLKVEEFFLRDENKKLKYLYEQKK